MTVTRGPLLLLAVPALNTQRHQTPFISPQTSPVTTLAGRIADTLAADTPLVFVVDDVDGTATFLATNTANIARAAVPAERADDVYVFVGTLDDSRPGDPPNAGNPSTTRSSRVTLADLPEGERGDLRRTRVEHEPSRSTDDRMTRGSTPTIRGSRRGPLHGARPAAAARRRRRADPGRARLRSRSPRSRCWRSCGWSAPGWSWWTFDDRVAAAAAARPSGWRRSTIAGLARGAARRGARRLGGSGPRLSVWPSPGGHVLRVVQAEAARSPASEVDERTRWPARAGRGSRPSARSLGSR